MQYIDNSDPFSGPQKTPSGGMDIILATVFLNKTLPEIKHWNCWLMDPEAAELELTTFTGAGFKTEGEIGAWRWSRLPCAYPNIGFWMGDPRNRRSHLAWMGLMKITGPQGQEFFMFSYLRKDDMIGKELLVSTDDFVLLRKFADDLMRHNRIKRRKQMRISVYGGPDMLLNPHEPENVYLPSALEDDIVKQVEAFFSSSHIYADLKVPYKRGFLFTGAPGTGKTMMIRKLAKNCHLKFKADCCYLTITARTDADDLERFFRVSSAKSPTIFILEDLESLTHETRVTRSALLAQLDGMESRRGALILATANNPEKIDPALVHRPSRFDRVWRFPLPGIELRHRYLADAFKTLEADTLNWLARETCDWTFAYMKELRITAAVLAAHDGDGAVTRANAERALELLSRQFKAGAKHHADDEKEGKLGFVASPDEFPDEMSAAG